MMKFNVVLQVKHAGTMLYHVETCMHVVYYVRVFC